MAIFSLSFLICIPYKAEINPKGKAQVSSGSKVKEEKDKKVKVKPEVAETSDNQEEKIPNKSLLTLSLESIDSTAEANKKDEDEEIITGPKQPLGSFHIEYTLSKGFTVLKIEVMYWDAFAKVKVGNSTKVLKIIATEAFHWIPFSVCHYINLTEEAVINLHASSIVIKVVPPKNQSHPSSKQALAFCCKKKLQFQLNKSLSFTELEEMREYDRTSENQNQSYEFINQLLQKRIDSMIMSEHIVSFLYVIPIEEHINAIEYAILKYSANPANAQDKASKPQVNENAVVTAKEKQNKGKKKKEKKKEKKKTSKNKKKNKKKAGKANKNKNKGKDKEKASTKGKESTTKKVKGPHFEIRGELLLSDIGVIKDEITPLTPYFEYCKLMVTVTDLLTDKQREHLKPLTIKLYAINHLPVNTLQENRISQVFLRYCFLDDANCWQTETMNINDGITFNDVHVLFLYQYENTPLMEYISSGHMTFELWGVKESELPVRPSIFGQRKSDCNISMKLPSNDVQFFRIINKPPPASEMLLAVAQLTLYELIHEPVITSCFLHNPGGMSPLTEALLSENCTELLVCLRPSRPLVYVLTEVQLSPTSIARLFVVFYNNVKALEVISQVYELNNSFLGASAPKGSKHFSELMLTNGRRITKDLHTEILLPSELIVEYLCQVPNAENYKQAALTGFVIDSFDKILLYLEGTYNGILQKVWNNMCTVSAETAKVMYNSNLTFENKLYSKFLSFGGIYVITLQERLEDILGNPQTYAKKNLPQIAWQTLMQLDMLLKTQGLKTACQGNIFPSAEGLVSFDKEFGQSLSDSEDEEEY